MSIVDRDFSRIDPRASRILKLRYGLEGRDPMTLKEIGLEIGLTRERVRQIQNLALRKLRKMIERLEKTKPKE